MLVLGRRPGEEIIIGDGPEPIVVRVIRVYNGNQVRLGIEAPAQVPIWRREVAERRAESLDQANQQD